MPAPSAGVSWPNKDRLELTDNRDIEVVSEFCCHRELWD